MMATVYFILLNVSLVNSRTMKSINPYIDIMQHNPSIFLHVDMDAFFASVEQHDHPELKGKPVIVGSPPDQRGVVSAASYEARQYGIHSAMPSRTAHQKCPHAVFRPVNMPRYKEVSRQIMQIFQTYTPWVQPLSIDEAFLDVTGAQRLFGSGPVIGEKIRRDIRKQTGLTASVGIAPNMFLAKIASDMNKPDGLTPVPFEQTAIERFLAPLPISRMWGVGKVTQKKLHSLGLSTIGELQRCDPARLDRAVGPHAAAVFMRLAHGIDPRSIETGCTEKSISNETTFRDDITERTAIEAAFKQLTDKVGARLRKAELFAATIHLKLRWDDFSTITRQTRLPAPCNDDTTLRETGMRLLNQNLQSRPVRLIGFGVSGLLETDCPDNSQLNLFETTDTTLHEKRKRLSQTADNIRLKYGSESLKRGSALNE
jgi:nucleotidyltransferase/DNA polymerase involved in DNA repair